LKSTSTESDRSDIDIFVPPSSRKLSKNKDINKPRTSDYSMYARMADLLPSPATVQYRDPAQPPFHNKSSSQYIEKSKRQNDTNNIEYLNYKKLATKSSPENQRVPTPIHNMKKQKYNEPNNFF
jgi:hypothetical protein